jgi:hypothetical protein
MCPDTVSSAPIFPGFDPRWRDVPDYILGITRDIWEDRDIAGLERYYAPDVVVRSPDSVVRGNRAIIAATLATLAEFPDRVLLGEDVIWAATPAADAGGQAGFVSSHRLTSLATHAGTGVYGAPTGQRLHYRVLADCWCAQNMVRDEWLVRDQGALLRQLGLEPRRWAADLIAREGGAQACAPPLTPDSDIDGPYAGTGTRSAVSDRLEDLVTRIMGGELAAIAQGYDRACELAYAGGVTGIGHGPADRFWLTLRSAFPSAGFRIEHRIGMDTPGHPPRAALRWSLYGRHDGPGGFGPATGAYVYVMGITHAEFGPRGLRREWTLIDETAIWKQIGLATG